MITIISDFDNLSTSVQGTHISHFKEYPTLVSQILTALQQNRDVTIIVHSRSIHNWLSSMSQRYPQGTFVFETLNAQMILEEKWGIKMPDDVRNEDILNIGLLSLDLHTLPGQTFEDLLLSHFYGPLFAKNSFPFTQLPQLISSVDKVRWKENRSQPLLSRLYSQRLDLWMNTARSSEQRQCIEWFTADVDALQQKLMAYRVLQAYPTVGEALLGDSYPVLSVLKLQLQDLAVDEKSIPDVVTQVTYTLNELVPASAEEIAELIDRVSGLLLVEFNIIEKHLKAHPDWLTLDVIDHLEIKFESLAKQIKKNLAALRASVHPIKPQAPDLTWGVDQMLAWATDQYLPYQAWCDQQEQFDPELFSLGDIFSQWLMDRWSDLHSNSKRMVFNILPNKAAELKNPEHIHLVLVVDNLGWSFAEILRDLFQEKGFYLTDAEPYLAMVPSETEISKKCLLAGQVGYTKIDDKSYKGMIEKGWVPYFNDKAFRYVANIGSLGKIESIEASTYVVNYLAVDIALHKSANEIGMPHREHIQHLLEILVKNTVAFTEKHGLQEKIHIHVVSDHGSTRIPAELQNDLDPVNFKSADFNAHSHRHVEVKSEKYKELPDNLKVDCFFLPRNDFLLPEYVLCARRANRFLPTDQNSYVHGGLLPEEIIVPYLEFETAKTPISDLTVLLLKNEFRYRMETIELEVGNPNDVSIEQVQISALNNNVESQPFLIPLLKKKSKTAVQMPARFKPNLIAEDQSKLRLRIRFRARGEQHVFDPQLDIVMKKMVEEKSTNVFDD